MQDPEVTTWLLLSLATVIGAGLQGAVGFGLGFTVVPVLALLDPRTIPTVPLLVSVPLLLATIAREARRTDLTGSALIVLGRLPGTALGVVLLLLVEESLLGVLVGSTLLATVGIGMLRTAPELTVANRVAAGFVSGMMGTAAGVGGPPVSFVYRSQAGAVLRATVAAALLAGVTLSLAAVGVAGLWETDHARLAATLLPAAMAGFAISTRVNRRLHQQALQRAVLVLGGVAGLATIIDALVA